MPVSHRRFFSAACVFALALLQAVSAEAATRYSRASNPWSTGSNWTTNPNCNTAAGGVVPAAGDDVVICNGDNITLDVSTPSLNSLTINAGGTLTLNNAAARTVTTVTLTNAGTLTITGNAAHVINVSGAFTNSNQVTVTNGTPSINVTGLLTNSGTLQMGGSAATTWQANGGIGNSGTITVNTGSNFTHNLEVQGNFTNTSTVNLQPDANSLCTLIMDGGTQTLGGGGTWSLYRLTLNNASGLTLSQSVTVTNQLTFTNGKITTGTNVLTLASGATVTGASSARYVIGTLERIVPAGSPTLAWDVGTATTYAPVSVAFNTVGTTGPMRVSTTDGDHPNIGTSVLDSTRSANRYWTISEPGALAFTSFSPTFTFVAADVDGGATPASFVAGKYFSGAWSYPDLGTRTATSTPASGILFADGMGDFALAESNPPAYSEYRFEQSSWNGTALEVIDSGTGAQHGQAARKTAGPFPSTANATPPLSGDPGSCRYGVFTRADRTHILLPATYPNLGAGSSFTVTAWIRTTNSALGAQRVFIDDANDSTGWGLSVGEGGTGTLRFYSRGTPSALTTDTANVIANNTWYFVAAVVDIALKRKRVYVISATGTVLGYTTAVYTEANFGAGDIGQSSIGAENNAATENTANDFGFDGNIDYVRVHQHPLGLEHLQQLRQARHPCIIPDHYAISFPTGATAVTCDPHQVTVTAHDLAHGGVSPSAGIQLGLFTSTALGTWTLVSGSGGFGAVGSNIGQAVYTWPGGESSATFRLRHNTAASVSVNLGDTYSKTEAATEDPLLTFNDAVFRTSNGSNAALAINTQIAGKPSNTGFLGQSTLHLQAIRTAANGACTSIFPANAEVDIEVGATCNNPATCSQNVTLTTSATTGTPSASFVPNGSYASTIRFRFSATGVAEAPFRFSYADAGQIALQFRAPMPSPPASTFVSGTTTAFVVRPFGIAISGVTTSAAPAPADASPYVAGTNFNATVTAKQWKTGDDANNDGIPDSEAQIAGNAATPNFGQETVPATVTLTRTLNAPAGGATGTLTGGTISGFTAGAATGAINWSEVGFINLFASAGLYLGAGSLATTNSAAGLTGVGRFRPHRFAVTNRGTLAAGCSTGTAYTYMGQPLGISGIQVTAQNAAGVTTTNYRGSYALFNPATFAGYNLAARGLDGSGTNLSTRVDTANSSASGSWGAATGVLTAAITTAIKRASPDTPDRFAQGRIGIAPQDSDGVTILAAAYDLDVDNNSTTDHYQLVGAGAGGNVDLRFGRLRVINSSGSEFLPLKVNIRTEYWNGSGFVTNTADGCTTLPRTAIAMSFTPALNLSACETAITTANVPFTAGVGALTLAAPGNGNTGNVLLTPQLGAAAAGTYCPSVGGSATAATAAGNAWLRGRWDDASNPDADAQTSYDDSPAARASFGVYGAMPTNVIFMRENY